jgi:hypothetical protein
MNNEQAKRDEPRTKEQHLEHGERSVEASPYKAFGA